MADNPQAINATKAVLIIKEVLISTSMNIMSEICLNIRSHALQVCSALSFVSQCCLQSALTTLAFLQLSYLRYYALYLVQADGLVKVKELLVLLVKFQRNHPLLIQISDSVIQLLKLSLYQLFGLCKRLLNDRVGLLDYLREGVRFNDVSKILNVFLVGLF